MRIRLKQERQNTHANTTFNTSGCNNNITPPYLQRKGVINAAELQLKNNSSFTAQHTHTHFRVRDAIVKSVYKLHVFCSALLPSHGTCLSLDPMVLCYQFTFHFSRKSESYCVQLCCKHFQKKNQFKLKSERELKKTSKIFVCKNRCLFSVVTKHIQNQKKSVSSQSQKATWCSKTETD